MQIITKIESQKKDKNRVAIFINDEFAFGIDASVASKFNFKKGDALDPDTISNVLLVEEKKRIKEKTFRFLAARAHSKKEIKTKLSKRGFSKELILQVISELEEAKYLDDEEFASSYSKSRMQNKPMGQKLLRYELLGKGVKEEISDKVIAEVYKSKSQEEVAADLVDRRVSRYKDLDDNKQKKRLFDFLMRRGFDWEVAKTAIAKIIT